MPSHIASEISDFRRWGIGGVIGAGCPRLDGGELELRIWNFSLTGIFFVTEQLPMYPNWATLCGRFEMSKTAQIRARVDPGLKIRAEEILKMVGMTPTEAIRLFYRQVIMMKGLPFEVRIPNETTLATMDRTDRGEDLRSFDNADDMADSLDR